MRGSIAKSEFEGAATGDPAATAGDGAAGECARFGKRRGWGEPATAGAAAAANCGARGNKAPHKEFSACGAAAAGVGEVSRPFFMGGGRAGDDGAGAAAAAAAAAARFFLQPGTNLPLFSTAAVPETAATAASAPAAPVAMPPVPSPPSCIAVAHGARESRNIRKNTQASRARPPPRQMDTKPSASAHRGSTAEMKARATPKNTSTQRKKRQSAVEGTRGRATRAGGKAADGGGRRSRFEAVVDGGAIAEGGGAKGAIAQSRAASSRTVKIVEGLNRGPPDNTHFQLQVNAEIP